MPANATPECHPLKDRHQMLYWILLSGVAHALILSLALLLPRDGVKAFTPARKIVVTLAPKPFGIDTATGPHLIKNTQRATPPLENSASLHRRYTEIPQLHNKTDALAISPVTIASQKISDKPVSSGTTEPSVTLQTPSNQSASGTSTRDLERLRAWLGGILQASLDRNFSDSMGLEPSPGRSLKLLITLVLSARGTQSPPPTAVQRITHVQVHPFYKSKTSPSAEVSTAVSETLEQTMLKRLQEEIGSLLLASTPPALDTASTEMQIEIPIVLSRE